MPDTERGTSAHMMALLILAFPWLDGYLFDTGCCVIWIGQRNAKGYGRAPRQPQGPKWPFAHRLLWVLAYGDPGPLTVDHTCGVRACVRLDHLRLLSRSENSRQGALRRHQGPSQEVAQHLGCQRLSQAHERPPVTAKGRASKARADYAREHPDEFTHAAVVARWRAHREAQRELDRQVDLALDRVAIADSLPSPLREMLTDLALCLLQANIPQPPRAQEPATPQQAQERGEDAPEHPGAQNVC